MFVHPLCYFLKQNINISEKNIQMEEQNLRCILKPYLEQYKKKLYPLAMECKLIGRA